MIFRMNRKPNTDQKIDILTENVGKLEATVKDVLEAVQGLASHMDERFAQVDQRFDQQDQKFATKEDLQNGLSDLENKVITEIDRFVVLHQTLDQEQMSQRSRFDRNEEFLARVAKRLEMEYQRT